jgi:hypothetical protein
MKKNLAGFLIAFLLCTGLGQASAQGGLRIDLNNLETTSFPVMTAGLDVFDASGNFVTGLSPETITLLEDNQPRPVTIEEFQPGVDFALALDPGAYFAYRDARGLTRFDKVVQVVRDWAAAHADSLGDDLSLVPIGGVPLMHSDSSAAFLSTLDAYQPTLQTILSSPQTLSLAMDAVSEPRSGSGMKPVVLYITSIPTAGNIPVLQNLTQRAVDQMIRVHVWIVTSPDLSSTSGATALKDIAIQTGGQWVLFSGAEPLPSPEEYLAPLRHAYRLEYSSAIQASGGHTLSAQVNLNGETVTSASLPFELDVQSPNPILVAPPEQIIRTAPDERTTETALFLPSQQLIDIIIEFPDGHTRPLVRTALYVDGIQVEENTAAPYDQFSWDLSGYSISSQHLLTVEAMDGIGLSKVSLGIPVQVTVVQPRFGLLPWLSRNRSWVALAAALFAGMGLGVILVRGRSRKHPPGTGRRASPSDPLTQSIPPGGSTRAQHLPWTRSVKTPEAHLVRLKDDGQPVTAPSIPIAQAEITFGSDPIQATRILDDPSVSPKHARLIVLQGEYVLSDEKSTAGTWVNYEQVIEPRRLQHGDVIHIGRVSYRFLLRRQMEIPLPQVIPLKK